LEVVQLVLLKADAVLPMLSLHRLHYLIDLELLPVIDSTVVSQTLYTFTSLTQETTGFELCLLCAPKFVKTKGGVLAKTCANVSLDGGA